tara:strand:+ start:1838 stop:2011 length:174 start_codon:yes stop_codon:yes gene_type:complete
MGRVTEFIHFINIDPKKLKLGQNLKGDNYAHITIRMKIKRARYQHQMMLRKIKKENK